MLRCAIMELGVGEVELREGTVVEGPMFPEPIRVERLERVGKFIRISGEYVSSGKYANKLIREEDVEKLRVLDTADVTCL